MTTKLTLDELRDLYYGSQDEAFKELESYPATSKPKIAKVLETKTVTLPIRRRVYYEFYKYEPDVRKPTIAYTNFRFISSITPINEVEFIVGGQRFDKTDLFKFVDDVPIIEILTAPNCLPHLETHSIAIGFDFHEPIPNDTFTFAYDIVELESPQDFYYYLLYQQQFTGEEILDDKTKQIILLYFNHPMVRLYAFLPENVVDARLLLNGSDHDLVFTKEKGKKYHTLEFGKDTTLNFSRIERSVLSFTTDGPNPEFAVRVYGISKQAVHVRGGMAGLQFSK